MRRIGRGKNGRSAEMHLIHDVMLVEQSGRIYATRSIDVGVVVDEEGVEG